ncbi:DgyrCDS14521 [Dimorphilus gyrociliatus]|uniref:DgyrCDS14521 n=1 Tax=Dimorphilus gyrociliatus TaxID=2664684 RepID=A0A7I8WDV2_9ANNE|nr:DgyrCDS14521 [Dimorphilus gyrociliatus]
MKILAVSLFVLFAIYQAHASELVSDLVENESSDGENELIDLKERAIDEEMENEIAKRFLAKLFSNKKGISKAQCALCAVAPASKRCQRVKKLCMMKHKIFIMPKKV